MVDIITLREVPLFTELAHEQLCWLSLRSNEMWLQSGEYLEVEGELPNYFYVLLFGKMALTKKVGSVYKRLLTLQPGSCTGHELILVDKPYLASACALTSINLAQWDKDTFWEMLVVCPSITRKLLTVTAQRSHMIEACLQQHAKLISLGTMAAGLAHELNNPSSVVQRATGSLREILKTPRSQILELQKLSLTPVQRSFLLIIERRIIEQATAKRHLEPLLQSNLEEELTNWLEIYGVKDGWKLASTLTGVGIGKDWLDTIIEHLGVESLDCVLRWLTVKILEVELLNEIEHSIAHICQLVQTIKDYSYMDQAPSQLIDVHEGLESTLRLLSYKLGESIVVNRQYDQSLPRLNVYGSDLNQVWTSLIDNAIDAVDGLGNIWLRTFRENEYIVVEVADDGSGIPLDVQGRIFEPFFTTKGVGEGIGLGLDITYRIVGQHHGDIQVFSQPGDTRFQVYLPITRFD
jgi:signal transduction histidine kinase